MAHRVTVVEAVQNHADLTVVFVGVMFRMAETPVVCGFVCGPVGFGDAEVAKHVRRAFAEPLAHFTLTIGDALEQILQEGSVAVFNLLPRNGVVFLFRKNLLPEALDVHLLEVAVKLTVVAPYAEVVHCLDADHGSLTGCRQVAFRGNLREDHAAEVQRHTGLFGHLIDVIAGSSFFVFNDRVAAQRAGVAAVVADLNLQTLRFAEEELAGAPTVRNLVGAAHIFTERDRRIGFLPNVARHTVPAAARGPEFKQGVRGGRNDVLVQRTEQIDVAFGDLLPFFLVGMNVDRLVADDNDAFEFLGSEDGADTAAGMLTGADEHGHRNEVFTGRSDHGDRSHRRGLVGKHLLCTTGALAPNAFGVAQFDFVVVDVEVNRFFRFTFDDDEVIAGLFEACSHVAADMSGGNHRHRIDCRINGRNGSTARAEGAGSGEGSRSDHELVGFIKRLSLRRNFVPENTVAQSSSADFVFKSSLVILPVVRFTRRP